MINADEARGLAAEAGKRYRLFFEKVRKPEEAGAILEIIFKEIELASSRGRPGVSIRFKRMEELRNLDSKIVDDLTTALNAQGFFVNISPGVSWFIAWGTLEEPFDPY